MKQSEENCIWFLDFVFSQSFGPFFLLPCSSPSCAPLVLLNSAFIHIHPSCPSSDLHAQVSSVACSRLGSVVQGEQALRELPDVPKVTYLY